MLIYRIKKYILEKEKYIMIIKILGIIIISIISIFMIIIWMALFIWPIKKMFKSIKEHQPKYERNNNMDEFDKFYEEICEEYKEYNDEINNYNKKINKQHGRALSIAKIVIQMVICLTLIILFGNIVPSSSEFLVALFSVAFLMTLAVTFIRIFLQIGKQVEEYQNPIKSEYKKRIVKKLIKKYSENLEYYPKEGLTREECDEASFNTNGIINGFSSEDLIIGKISNNCQIKMSEVKETKPSSDDSGVGYVFYGLFAKITLPYDLDMSFIMQRKYIYIRKDDEENHKLQTDSTEFEKYYDVCTGDKILTLSFFTSDTMQKMLDFINMTNVIPEISLHKNNLYMRFSTGDVFEPKVEKVVLMNPLDKENIRKTYNMVNIIFELIEKISNDILEFEK